MKTPLQDRWPTQQELMEYVDGTAVPQKYREIELLVSESQHLQNEVALLRAMRKTMQNEITYSPSKKFTANVMNEILPVRQTSFWFRMARNSSNIFAMILVLSLIGIVLVSNPGASKNEKNLFSQGVESYTSVYNSIFESLSHWTKQYSQPLGEISKSSSGKFMLLGLLAFFILMAIDELFGKKYFHARIKH